MNQYETLINEIQFAQKIIEDAPKDTPHEVVDMWLQGLHVKLQELHEIRNAEAN